MLDFQKRLRDDIDNIAKIMTIENGKTFPDVS